MEFRSFEEYKEKCPESREIFGPGRKISYALWIEGNRLTKKKILELTGLSEEDFSKGIEYLLQTKEIYFQEDADHKRYSLEQKTRENLDKFYKD